MATTAGAADVIVRRARPLDIERAASSLPTDAQLARINSMARRELRAADVYIFPAEVSSTDVDDYYTWMHGTSLENGARAANAPRGLPLMPDHALRGTRPLGKWFEGVISRTARPVQPRAVPFARDMFNRNPDGDRQLRESAYMIRGGNADGAIEDIDTGIQDAVSWGATVSRQRAPGGDFICDVCDKSLLRTMNAGGCRHWPGLTVDTPQGPVIATARYVNAVQVEASLVAIGSNEAAFIQRAAQGVRDGDLSPEEIEQLEAIYGAAIGPTRHYSIPAGAGSDAASQPPTTEAEPMTTGTQAPTDAVRAFLGDELAGKIETYRAAGRDDWEVAARVLAAEVTAVAAARVDAERARTEQDAVVRAALGLADGEDLATGFARIAVERQYGQAARTAALDELCATYVRAHDVKDGWDKDAYLARRAGWSGADIASETAELERIAKTRFPAGSVAERQINDGGETTPAPTGRPMVPGFTNA